MLAIHKFAFLHTSVTTVLIASLSLSDFVFGISVIVYSVIGCFQWPYFGLLARVFEGLGEVSNNRSIHVFGIMLIGMNMAFATLNLLK